MAREPRPLLVIAGPTASGKSRLALDLAAAIGGEIVSADAVAVYRGLDIGSDKPSAEERVRVRHHLIDVVEPTACFSAGEFSRQAHTAIADISRRGSTPLVVGGSHFYLSALLEGLFPSPPRDPAASRRLHHEWDQSPDRLYDRLRRLDPSAACGIGPRDRQRVVRALEFFELTGGPISAARKSHREGVDYRCLMVVPERSTAELYARIDERVDRMFATGLVGEVKCLLAAGVPRHAHALKAIGYRQALELVQGRQTLAAAVLETKRASRRFAKRQLAWLRGLQEGVAIRVPPAERDGAARVAELWQEHNGESRVS